MTLSLPDRSGPAPDRAARYRHALPQLEDRLFLTDGGLETTLIFLDGIELPGFASFVLLASDEGRTVLDRYFGSYAEIALRDGAGLVFETATWRANPDWLTRLGYRPDTLEAVNRAAVEQLAAVRERFETPRTPIVISGCIGPRGDGYEPGRRMSAAAAERYHAPQVVALAAAGADMISAITMNYLEEAIGVARAAVAAGMPAAISFTVETDGRLPTGRSLGEAIERVDAATGAAPVYYMINCAHPTHFADRLAAGGAWRERIRGVRANASTMSHAELDAAEELDDGDPADLGRRYAELTRLLPNLTVMGGCCGTDHRHIDAISRSCAPLF